MLIANICCNLLPALEQDEVQGWFVILQRKTSFWRAHNETKTTDYAGSPLRRVLLNEYLSLVFCIYTELFCEGHSKNAMHPPLSTDFKHPHHSCVDIPAALRMNLAVWQGAQCTTHHQPKRGKAVLQSCLYLLLDATPVMATWLTGMLGTGKDFWKSAEAESLLFSAKIHLIFQEAVNTFRNSIT